MIVIKVLQGGLILLSFGMVIYSIVMLVKSNRLRRRVDSRSKKIDELMDKAAQAKTLDERLATWKALDQEFKKGPY